jgi:Rad/Gem-related GTP binding protein 1
MEEDCSTTATSLSRPCSPRSRAGSVKGGGGLALLASRRGSRDSQLSQASAEDVGPLNFSSNPRGRQRRTSNFLELPGTVCKNRISSLTFSLSLCSWPCSVPHNIIF